MIRKFFFVAEQKINFTVCVCLNNEKSKFNSSLQCNIYYVVVVEGINLLVEFFFFKMRWTEDARDKYIYIFYVLDLDELIDEHTHHNNFCMHLVFVFLCAQFTIYVKCGCLLAFFFWSQILTKKRNAMH